MGRCEWVEVDGEMVRVQTDGRPWDDKDHEAFAEIVRAAKRMMEERESQRD